MAHVVVPGSSHIVVTGASSFIGSWMVRHLVSAGSPVTALVRPATDTWRLRGIDSATVVRVDSRDWADTLRDLRPEVVISLDWAGVSGADRDNEEQWSNVDRVASLAEAAIVAGSQRFVGVGSHAEYGPHEGPLPESTLPQPASKYGQAKLATLGRVSSVCEEHGASWAWARVFSTYGPLDNAHWLFPLIADAVLAGRDIDLSGGEQLWSYLYGSDAGAAIATIATHPHSSGVYNVGNPQPSRLRDLIQAFGERLGSTHHLKFGARPYDPGSVMHLEPVVDRLAELGWKPQTTMNAGLDATAAWLMGQQVADPVLRNLDLPAKP